MSPSRLSRSTPTAPLKALLMGSLLVPAIVFGVAAWTGYKEAFRNAEERATRVSAMLEEHALKALESVTLMLRVVDQRLRGVDWQTIRSSRALWDEVREVQQLATQAGSIFIVDGEGQSALTTRQFPPAPIDFSDRDYFVVQRDTPELGVYVGRSYTGRISQGPIFNLSIRRTTPDDRFEGVIGSSGQVEYFEHFYATVGLPEDNFSIVLMRNDGEALVRYPRQAARAQFPGDAPYLRALELQDSVTFTARSPSDDVERLYAAKRLAGFPLTVLYGIDRDTILAAWHAHLLQWGVISTLVGAALFLTSWLALRRTRDEADAVAMWRQASADLLREAERRADMEKAFLQAQKQEAIGQLTAGVAHDFNNLLAVVVGNLELLKKRAPMDERTSRLLEGALGGARRGVSLTQRLLAFARRQDLTPQVIEIPALIEGLKEMIQRALGATFQIKVDLARALPTVRADSSQLEMAILNILINARDATPAGGRIAITARDVVLASPEPDGLPAGRYVCLSVADSGVGMDDATLVRATEPFFTTKGVGKGTGLGLSMVYGFAQQSGGTLRLRSELGRGTTAEIWLPADGHAPEREEQHAPSAPDAVPKSRRILVVDDDFLVGEAVVAMLEDLGHSAHHVSSGAAALAALRAEPGYDAVITDQAMPEMTGVQLVQAIREQWPALPVMLATGHSDLSGSPGPRVRILVKPFRDRELAEALEATVAAARAA